MKTRMIPSLLAVIFSAFAVSANAASIEQANCVLTGAPAGGTASSVQTVQFGNPVQTSVGAVERKASLGSTTVTLGEAGAAAYVTIQDIENKVYFAASFEGTAMYATPKLTIQVKCN